jgi:REP element-mobilizing transposase RayT
MKSKYKIVKHDTQPYFVTMNVHMKIPVFTKELYAQCIMQNLSFYRENNQLQIYAYIIMDTHIHLIVAHESNLSGVLQRFKSYTAKQCIALLQKDDREWILPLMKEHKASYKKDSLYQFWQEGNHPRQRHTVQMFNQKVEYIHHNPVRRGLVDDESGWKYSSARAYAGMQSIFAVDQIEELGVSGQELGNILRKQ